MLRRLASSFGCCTWLPSQPCSPWMLVVLVLILLDWIPLRALLPGAGEGGTGGRGDVVHVCLAGDILIVGETYISLGYNQMNEFNDPPPAATQVVWWSVFVRSFMSRVLRSQGWWCRIFPPKTCFFLGVIHSESSHWMAEIGAARFCWKHPWSLKLALKTNHCEKKDTPAITCPSQQNLQVLLPAGYVAYVWWSEARRCCRRF